MAKGGFRIGCFYDSRVQFFRSVRLEGKVGGVGMYMGSKYQWSKFTFKLFPVTCIIHHPPHQNNILSCVQALEFFYRILYLHEFT